MEKLFSHPITKASMFVVIIVGFFITTAVLNYNNKKFYYEFGNSIDKKSLTQEPFKKLAENWEGIAYLNIFVDKKSGRELSYEISSNPPSYTRNNWEVVSSKKIVFIK